jgi:hypothetical protein
MDDSSSTSKRPVIPNRSPRRTLFDKSNTRSFPTRRASATLCPMTASAMASAVAPFFKNQESGASIDEIKRPTTASADRR